MSSDISAVRRNLSKVSTGIKQGNFLFAAQSLRNGVALLGKKSLMRSEQEEFISLIMNACQAFSQSSELKKIFPLAIKYDQGEEAALIDVVDQLIAVLNLENESNAIEINNAIIAKKQKGLAKGQEALDNKQFDEARESFNALCVEFTDDVPLMKDIAERFLEADLCDDAVEFFKKALETSPEDAWTLNRLAIALRKIKRYDAAEEYFKKALALDEKDPKLHFNLGRLFFDQKMWGESVNSAQKAIELDPDFVEAKKLFHYCKKKLEAPSE